MPLREDWTREELTKEFDEMSGVTIPVNIRIEARQKILCLDAAERILRDARRIAVGECECRAKMKRCDGPLDVCLFLEEGADQQIEKGLGKQVSVEEGLDILRETTEKGLMHVALVGRGSAPVKYICSCCSCCCQCIAAMQRLGYHDALVFSDMVAAHSPDLCDDCGACVERCNFDALTMVDDRLRFERSKCFGCGVCLSSCPSGALLLQPRVKA
jgi:ferredoxin